MSGDDERPGDERIPSSWAQRAWRTGRVALSAGRLAARQALGTRGADLEGVAQPLVEQLDELKGLAMKVGQIVSYLDVPLAPEAQGALGRLQEGRRALSFEALMEVVERSLGAPWPDLFDAIEPAPVAAASIGQVHRGVLRGRPVAIKVRYPGVRDTFRRDLGALDRVASLASLATQVDGRALVRELAARLEEECDYAREARMQAAFAHAFAHWPGLTIPAVVEDRTSDEVLTTAWEDGLDLEAFRRDAAPSVRARAGALMTTFAYEGLLVLCAVQADPHPGNFRFRADGSVVCLDFGCVRAFDDGLVQALRGQVRSVLDDDRPAFREHTRALGLVGDDERFDFDHFFEASAHLYAPFRTQPFRIDAAFARRGYAYHGPSSPNARRLALPPAQIWIQRLQWGLWSVLGRLDADLWLRDVLDDLLARPVRPLLGPAETVSTDGLPAP